MAKTQEEWQPRFLNQHEFVWDGYEWQIPAIGSHWIMLTVLNPSYRFTYDLQDEIGRIPGWCTLAVAERQIFKCWRYPIIAANPDALFLRKSLDTWVELNACRIYNRVYDMLRLRFRKDGLRDGDADRRAEKRAEELRIAFEQLYLPGTPTKVTAAPTKQEPVPEPAAQPRAVHLHSGLRRNLQNDAKLRAMLDKIQTGGRLNDSELAEMLLFWGIQVRAAETIGQRFDLAYQAAKTTHDGLVAEASRRNWTQSLMNMMGVQIEGVFDRIVTR